MQRTGITWNHQQKKELSNERNYIRNPESKLPGVQRRDRVPYPTSRGYVGYADVLPALQRDIVESSYTHWIYPLRRAWRGEKWRH